MKENVHANIWSSWTQKKIGRREYKNGNIRKIQAPDGQLLSMDDPMFQDTISGIIVPDGYKIVTVPFKDLYPTFENYMEVYHGYKERDHETGRYGTWLNPNGRWEEWCIGGQFHGF